jgi:oligopeptidase B
MRYIWADKPDSEFRVVLPRQQDVEYSASHRGAHLYMVVREKDKPNSELRVAPVEDPTAQQVGGWEVSCMVDTGCVLVYL